MSKLPNHAAAIIADQKLTDYLLSSTHHEGSPKAKFFESFGFSRQKPEVLRHALLVHAEKGDVLATTVSQYGTTYDVNAQLETPDGRNPWLLVIWMIDVGMDQPRLITAIPSEDMA